jgi:hypothetical protein
MSDLDTNHIILMDGGKEIRFRKSLFWDLPEESLDLTRYKRLILERVFSRGNIKEFQAVNRHYSRDEIRKTVLQIGSLDKKTLHFISSTYELKASDFLCYKKNQ